MSTLVHVIISCGFMQNALTFPILLPYRVSQLINFYYNYFKPQGMIPKNFMNMGIRMD